MAYRINGLGRVSSPLAIVQINGENKLIVHPAAAIGTDVIGLTLATALFFSTKSTLLRIISVGGALWMTTAMVKEIAKLFAGPERQIEVQEPVLAGARTWEQVELLPSGAPAAWTAELAPSQQRIAGRRQPVIFMR